MSGYADIALDADGDLPFGEVASELVTGAEGLRQRIAVALDVNRGEWFLDLAAGIPWSQLFESKADAFVFEVAIRARINEVPGVDRVVSLETTSRDRRLSVKFTVETAGESVTMLATLAPDDGALSILAE